MSEQEMIKKLGELTSEVEKLKANKKSLAERNMQAEKENDDLRKQIEQLESFNAELNATVKEQTEMLNGGKLYEDYQEVCIKNSKLNATVDVLVEKISMLKAVGLIEAELESYIWDKAADMGLTLRVQVTVEPDGSGVPVPVSVELTGPRSEVLSRWLETELGVPAERQVWNEN